MEEPNILIKAQTILNTAFLLTAKILFSAFALPSYICHNFLLNDYLLLFFNSVRPFREFI